MDELMLPPEGEEDTMEDTDLDITIPDEGEDVMDKTDTEPEEQIPETIENEGNEKGEKEFDLSDLFSDLDDSNESLDKSSETIDNIDKAGSASAEDIAILKEENSRMKDSYKRLEDQLKKIAGEKSDLMFKNAELEAFGGEFSNPQMLMLSRNLEKAQAGDEKSKSKVETILKDMLSGITGEDYDTQKVNKEADILAASESYNTASNPNLKSKGEEEDTTITL